MKKHPLQSEVGIRNRVSIPYLPSTSYQSSSDAPDLYTHILWDDVNTMIIPYSISSRDKTDYSVRLSPDSDVLQRIVMHTFLGAAQGQHYDFEDVVTDFIRDTASRLFYKGQIYFEILDSLDQVDGLAIKVLDRIRGKTVAIGMNVIQIIPAQDRRKLGRNFVWIPRTKVWRLKFPGSLGGNRQLKRVQSACKKASEHVPKDLRNKDEWPQDTDIPLRVNQFDLSRIDVLSMATQSWGWNARGLWKEKMLEYYYILRELRFARTLAILREYILLEMNNYLKNHDVSTAIEISGLLSSSSLEERMELFRIGKLSFKEIIETI
ncbi:hypothetical protein MASR1M31_25080 [Porphyromonadaceae bacterium]